jgi:hypothetical protein
MNLIYTDILKHFLNLVRYLEKVSLNPNKYIHSQFSEALGVLI